MTTFAVPQMVTAFEEDTVCDPKRFRAADSDEEFESMLESNEEIHRIITQKETEAR